MTTPRPKLNPLSRNPLLDFHTVKLNLYNRPEVSVWKTGTEIRDAKCIGTVEATASLPGWADTQMYFRVLYLDGKLLLGQRCGYLHTPHINSRSKDTETLWCTTCWTQTNVPFYLYYRHYEDHVIDHLSPCDCCEKRFQVWDADEQLREGHTYLLSAIHNLGLETQVKAELEKHNTRSLNT